MFYVISTVIAFRRSLRSNEIKFLEEEIFSGRNNLTYLWVFVVLKMMSELYRSQEPCDAKSSSLIYAFWRLGRNTLFCFQYHSSGRKVDNTFSSVVVAICHETVAIHLRSLLLQVIFLSYPLKFTFSSMDMKVPLRASWWIGWDNPWCSDWRDNGTIGKQRNTYQDRKLV